MYTTNPLKSHKSSALVFKRSLPVLYLFMYDWPLYGVYLVSKDNVPSNIGMPSVRLMQRCQNMCLSLLK